MQFQLEAQQKELLVLTNQAHLQLKNAYKNNDEVKIQLEASQMAYKQQIALYENGLSNLVDFTQALYSLNRAEIFGLLFVRKISLSCILSSILDC